MHTVVGAGKAEGAMDAGNMLKPMLARGELHMIGATTLDEYRKYIEKDAALERRFQPVMVEEPSVEDTISILRGLKERYEVHHGVRITDPAVIAAATLSQRYITDRQLPDKAIDLIDEAAARLRTEIDSKPQELDEVDRQIMQLEIEREALKKEKDKASKERLEKLVADLAELKERSRQITARWQNEKQAITELRAIKEQIETTRTEIERAERQCRPGKGARLRYGTLRELESKLAEAEKRLERHADGWRPAQGRGRPRRDRRRGRPLDGHPGLAPARRRDARNCCAWKMACTNAWSARKRPCGSSRMPCAVPVPVCRIPIVRSAPSFSWVRPAWARPNWRVPWRSSCSMMSSHDPH